MGTTKGDDLRFRVIIDDEMPELYARLSASKKPGRECVHLMRMGLQFEMALSGRLPLFQAAGPSTSAELPAQPVKGGGVVTATPKGKDAEVKATTPAPAVQGAETLMSELGISSDFFQAAPLTYAA